jgi:hypothetical protein
MEESPVPGLAKKSINKTNQGICLLMQIIERTFYQGIDGNYAGLRFRSM